MMKTVKTVTFHLANNYGALLQAYALQKVLQKKYNTEILNYDNTFISNNYKVFKPISKNPIKTIYHLFKDIYNYNKETKKVAAFDKFRKKLILSDYFSDKDKIVLPGADAYIVGSDQVWNPFLTNGVDSVYTLKNIKNSKKISYAASSGILKYIEQNSSEFLKNIQQFDFISVREKNLKEYLDKNIKDKEIKVVLDPTLLLNKNDWIKLCGDKRIENEKYIFVYSVNNANNLFYEFVNKLANDKNLKIVYFDKRDLKNNFKYKKKSYYSTGPSEFLNLLYNAEYVVTTSFHGTALSCLLNKKFFVILSTFPDRLTTLLNNLSLESQIVNKLDDYNNMINYQIEWIEVNKKLAREKESSLEWLFNSIERDLNE